MMEWIIRFGQSEVILISILQQNSKFVLSKDSDFTVYS